MRSHPAGDPRTRGWKTMARKEKPPGLPAPQPGDSGSAKPPVSTVETPNGRTKDSEGSQTEGTRSGPAGQESDPGAGSSHTGGPRPLSAILSRDLGPVGDLEKLASSP